MNFRAFESSNKYLLTVGLLVGGLKREAKVRFFLLVDFDL